MTNKEIRARMWEAYVAGRVSSGGESPFNRNNYHRQQFLDWVAKDFPELLGVDYLRYVNIETNHGDIKM